MSNFSFGDGVLCKSIKQQTGGTTVSFKDEIMNLAKKALERKEHIRTEEAAKQALIIPFIQVLGYDTSNPLEVWPEYSAGFNRTQEKVDYAILRDGTVIMLIEAKPVKDNLSTHDCQLSKYFNATPDAKFGIMTNGLRYRFFSDLTSPNLIDKAPFFEFDFGTIKDSDVEILKGFCREEFEADKLVALAEELVYSSKMKPLIIQLLRSPSDELVRLLVRQIDPKARLTSSLISRYREITKNSITDAMVDMFRQGIVQQPSTAASSDVPPIAPLAHEELPSLGFFDGKEEYDEKFHLEGKPQPVVGMFRQIDTFIDRLDPKVETRYRKQTINYCLGKRIFCSVHVAKGGLRIWLSLDYSVLTDCPKFVSDASSKGHWGAGDVEVKVGSPEHLETAQALIRRSYESCC